MMSATSWGDMGFPVYRELFEITTGMSTAPASSELGRGQDGGRLPNLPADRRGRHLPGAFFSHTIGRQWSRAGDDWTESNDYQE